MCLFQLFVASSRPEIFFSNELAGASSGRSANSRKNKFQNFEALHFYLGQKNVDMLIWLFVYSTQPINQTNK
jgi:hypothetical protein